MHYALVLLALGALLALHEWGHLVAARLLGVKVPRFVFGFGPPLLSFRLWGTQYVLAAVPLGATAHIQGMNPHRADAEEPASFRAVGPLRRVLIVLAGPLANLALALGILFTLYTSGTHVVVPLTVGTVQPGSEAARAQLLPGDRIVSVAGQPLKSWSEFVEKVAESPGRPLELGVDRHGEQRTVQVRPRPDERGAGRIGVSQQYVYRAHGASEALGHSFAHIGNVATEGLSTLARLVTGPKNQADATGPGALMRQESSDAASSGADKMLRALVAASVALALLTMLPVPGLDGGRVLLLLLEAASGRKLPARVETVAQTVGFLAIAVAIVAMAGAEIRRALPEPAQPLAPVATAPPTARPASDAGTFAGNAVAPDASTPARGATVASAPPAVSDAGAAATLAVTVPPVPRVPGDAGAAATLTPAPPPAPASGNTGAASPLASAPPAAGDAGAAATLAVNAQPSSLRAPDAGTPVAAGNGAPAGGATPATQATTATAPPVAAGAAQGASAGETPP